MTPDSNPNPNQPRASFTPHLVVGVGLIFLGVVLVLDRLGIVEVAKSLEYWPVGLILLGAAIVAQAMRGGSAVPSDARGQFPIGPAILLLVFVLVFVRPFRPETFARDAGGRQQIVAVLGGDVRRSSGEPFRGAHMTAVMGGTELDLRNAVVTDSEPIVIEVFTLMGGTVIRVPQDWTVDLKVTPVMGGVTDERRKRASASFDTPTIEAPRPVPHLVIRGSVMMGGVVIKG